MRPVWRGTEGAPRRGGNGPRFSQWERAREGPGSAGDGPTPARPDGAVMAVRRDPAGIEAFRLHLATPAGNFDAAPPLALDAKTLHEAKAEAEAVIHEAQCSRAVPSAEVQSVSKPWCGARWDGLTGKWSDWDLSPDY